jgi:hypothetical protein
MTRCDELVPLCFVLWQQKDYLIEDGKDISAVFEFPSFHAFFQEKSALYEQNQHLPKISAHLNSVWSSRVDTIRHKHLITPSSICSLAGP